MVARLAALNFHAASHPAHRRARLLLESGDLLLGALLDLGDAGVGVAA